MGDLLDVRENVIRKFENMRQNFFVLFSDIQWTYTYMSEGKCQFFVKSFTKCFYQYQSYYQPAYVFCGKDHAFSRVCLSVCLFTRGLHVTTHGPVQVCLL